MSDVGQSFTSLEEGQLESLLQKMGYRSSGRESVVEIFQGELDYHRRQTRALLRSVLGLEAG